MKMTIIIALLLFSSTVSADEVFDCSNNIILTIGEPIGEPPNNFYYSTVIVGGTTQKAFYKLAGIEHRWEFPVDAPRYIITVKPNGTANYFDTSIKDEDGLLTSTFKFSCTKRPKEKQ